MFFLHDILWKSHCSIYMLHRERSNFLVTIVYTRKYLHSECEGNSHAAIVFPSDRIYCNNGYSVYITAVVFLRKRHELLSDCRGTTESNNTVLFWTTTDTDDGNDGTAHYWRSSDIIIRVDNVPGWTCMTTVKLQLYAIVFMYANYARQYQVA